jgi:hypothetical protein
MCVFCIAIPATLAVVAVLNAKQIQEGCKSDHSVEKAKIKKGIPAGKETLALTGTLVVGSVIYHSQFGEEQSLPN